MIYRRFFTTTVLLLVVGLSGGCDLLDQGGDGDGDKVLEQIAGSWVAIEYRLINSANSSQHVDLIDQGVYLALEIESDGSYTSTWADSGGTTETGSGMITVEGDTLIVVSDNEEDGTLVFQFLHVAGVLTLTGTESYDFDGDEQDETAVLVIVFHRPQTGGDVSMSDLAGTWAATHFTFIDNSDPTVQADMIAFGGFFTLIVETEGAYTVVMGIPGEEDGGEIDTGTLAISGDSLSVVSTSGGEDQTLGFALVENTLTLVVPDNNYDFDNDDVDDAATLTIVLRKIENIPLAELTGMWSASEMVLAYPTLPHETVNMLEDSGVIAFTLEVEPSGAYTAISLNAYDDTTEVDTGTLSVMGNILFIDSEGEEEQDFVQITLDGDLVKVRSVSDHYDWNMDGVDDPANMRMTLRPVTELGPAEFAGAWSAGIFRHTDPEHPDLNSFNFLEYGGTFTMLVEGSGAFEMLQSTPADSFEMQSGTVEIFGDLMIVSIDGESEPKYMKYRVAESHWYLTMPDHMDWNEDGEDDPSILEIAMESITPATLTDLAGSWTASSWVFEAIYESFDSQQMIVQGEPTATGAFSLTLAADGNYSAEMQRLGEASPETDTGVVEIFGDMLLISSTEGDLMAIRYQLVEAGTTLILTSNDDSYDFNEDGNDEAAFMVLTLVKGGTDQ